MLAGEIADGIDEDDHERWRGPPMVMARLPGEPGVTPHAVANGQKHMARQVVLSFFISACKPMTEDVLLPVNASAVLVQE